MQIEDVIKHPISTHIAAAGFGSLTMMLFISLLYTFMGRSFELVQSKAVAYCIILLH